MNKTDKEKDNTTKFIKIGDCIITTVGLLQIFIEKIEDKTEDETKYFMMAMYDDTTYKIAKFGNLEDARHALHCAFEQIN